MRRYLPDLAVTSAVALAVLGPLLLGRGFWLVGDMVFVPHQPWKSAWLGLDGSLPRAVPMDALVSVTTHMVPGSWVQRALLLGGLLLGGIGIGRVVREHAWYARAAAITLLLWNPWVYERLLIGQWAILLGYLAESLGRKRSAIVYFVGCLIIVPIVYLTVSDPTVAVWLQLIAGFLTGGTYSWYTVHTPELFGTAYRATAISVVFSGSRYLAMIGAVLTGTLSAAVGGFGHAAVLFTPLYLLGILAVLVLPETRGKPLPA